MAGGVSSLEMNLNVVAGAAIFCVLSFLPSIGEKGAGDPIVRKRYSVLRIWIVYVYLRESKESRPYHHQFSRGILLRSARYPARTVLPAGTS